MDPYRWQCPFCSHHATIKQENNTVLTGRFNDGNKHDLQWVRWEAITCPNPECREYAFSVQIHDYTPGHPGSTGGTIATPPRHEWQLVPSANMKVMPAYLPAPIAADYKEACLIATLSPKASATLSRRCLQGMIRDYWGVSKARLVDEIDAIKDEVDGLAWNAIDGLRKIGNIGAHMEKDINVIVDVDPNEAQLMIGLIETLVDDWYVTRHERRTRMEKLVDAVKGKFQKPSEPT